jgi:hypothetical protein
MWCFKFPNLFSLFEILLPPPSASVFFDSRARVLYAPPRSSSPVLGLLSLRSQLPPLFPCWSLLDREFGSEGFSSRPNSSLPLSFFCRRQRSIFAAWSSRPALFGMSTCLFSRRNFGLHRLLPLCTSCFCHHQSDLSRSNYGWIVVDKSRIALEQSDQKGWVFWVLIALTRWFLEHAHKVFGEIPVRTWTDFWSSFFCRHSLACILANINSCFHCDSRFSNSVPRASDLSISM